MIRVVGLILAMSLSQTIYAKSSGEVLSDAHYWIYKNLPLPWVHGGDGEHCRVTIQYLESGSSSIPRLLLEKFNPRRYEVSRENFVFGGDLEKESCSISTKEHTCPIQTELEVKCRWEECEMQGCVNVASKFSILIQENYGIWYQVNDHECFVEFPEDPGNG